MYTLYGSKRCASMIPQIVLEEAGVPYEYVEIDLDKKEHKTASYLRMNPPGLVPTLVVDGEPMFESGAACMLLADRHPETRLAPPVTDPRRGRYYQWMVYLSGTLHLTYLRWLHVKRHVRRPEDIPTHLEHETKLMKGALAILDEALESRPFLLGDEMTCPDIYLWTITAWLTPRGVLGLPHQLKLVHPFRNVMRCIEKIWVRSSVKRVFDLNTGPDWKPRTEEWFASSIIPLGYD